MYTVFKIHEDSETHKIPQLDYLVHIDHGIFQSTGAGFRPSTFSRCSENLGGPFWNLFALQKCRVCRGALAKYT